MTDDQGVGDLGCTGNPWLKTPNIDRFAQEAVRCHDFHVAPLCTPTRGGLMTARHPLRNGAWATAWGRSLLKRRERTLAELFASNGYRTGLFGKWHLGDAWPYRPQDRGFSRVVAHKGGGVGQTPDFWGNDYFDDTYESDGHAMRFEGYCTDVWFQQATRFIDEDDSPFLACIMTNAPHTPYFVADRYASPYRGHPDIVEPEFYGMIANIDENVGRLRAHLQARGLERDTVLVFLTDNGTSGGCVCDTDGFVQRGYNAGLRGKKASLYDGGHKVPFFLRYPAGGLVDRDVPQMISYLDLLPTLTELCELAPSPDPVSPGAALDGTSALAALAGRECVPIDDDPTRVPILVMQNQQGPDPPARWENAVLAGRWRLIEGRELYDVQADPGQRHDIAGAHPGIVACLRARHAAWWDDLQGELAERAPLVLGDAHENPTRLDAMDAMGDIAWDQPHVRQAVPGCGRWFVGFARPGHYRFELRRWPAELGSALDALPADACDPDQRARSRRHGASGDSVALPIRRGELVIGEAASRAEAAPGSGSITFERYVSAGQTDLEATLLMRDGGRIGAYYVYVEWLRP